MSPNNPGNFVNDLVEMAKAFEALPKVQAELDDLKHDIDRHLTTITRLETKLMDRANEIDSLNSRIRTLEVDRDHAETMFLEADDRTARALDFIKATFGNAGSLIQALEPPKAEPDMKQIGEDVAYSYPSPEPEGLHTTQPVGQSEADPTIAVTSQANASTQQSANVSESASSSTPPPSPASEAALTHPTPTDASSMDGDGRTPQTAETSVDTASSTTAASSMTDASFPMPPISPGRYSGKTYSAAKRDEGLAWEWPNQDEWLENGGTLDNYFA